MVSKVNDEGIVPVAELVEVAAELEVVLLVETTELAEVLCVEDVWVLAVDDEVDATLCDEVEEDAILDVDEVVCV
jgi:hypothetical protein